MSIPFNRKSSCEKTLKKNQVFLKNLEVNAEKGNMVSIPQTESRFESFGEALRTKTKWAALGRGRSQTFHKALGVFEQLQSHIWGKTSFYWDLFWHKKKWKNIEPFDNSTVSQLEELKRQEPGRELPASQSITAAKATNEKFVSTIT